MVSFKPESSDLKRLTPLMVASARFKALAGTDYAKALLTFAEKDGLGQLSAIDDSLWDPAQSQFAWMLFFNSAVRVYSGTHGQFPIVGYYNPYSDTFLITVWRPHKKLLKIVDAEMLMGDWVRDRTADLDLIPLWLRDKVHRPVALGLSVARSTLAFERVFASATPNTWRKKLQLLTDPTIMYEVNYPGAALMMNNHLINVINFSQPQPDDKRLQTCKRLTIEAMKLAANGDIGKTLALADDTPADTGKGLQTLSNEWFSSLKVAGALTDPEGCLVLLSPAQQTNSSIALFFKGSKNRFKAKRIDVIDYQYFYNQLKYSRMQSREGGAR